MTDFFISYNRADRSRAEWIAWVLEDAGYRTILQAWDFLPGSNFVLEMQKAAAQAERTIAVLSSAYLNARYTQPEWAAAFAKDPTGERAILLPIRIAPCDVAGLISPIVYIDLVDLEEDAARERLLSSVRHERAKPLKPPIFPGSVRRSVPERPHFPGTFQPDGPDVLEERDTSFNTREAVPAVFERVFDDWKLWLKGEDPFNAAGQQYNQILTRLCDTIRIIGMDAPRPLRRIYVRVNILNRITAHHSATVGDLEDFFQGDTRGFGFIHETTSALEAVNTIQYIMLLGKPGAGKSTFLKYLTLLAVDGKLATSRVPVFVSLKEWSDSGISLFDFVAAQFEACNFPDAIPYVRRLLFSGSCLLLLDGLDEVSGDTSKTLAHTRAFCNTYPKNQFVITCRIAAYDYVFEHFTEIEIADFADAEISTFITNWFDTDSRKAALCFTELTTHRSIHELARLPLLLAMICLAFDEHTAFPNNREQLYKDAINALLRKWDASKDVKRQDVYKELTLERKVALLAFIAFHTFPKGQHFLRSAILGEYVRDGVAALLDNGNMRVQLDCEAIITSIEAQHGLLVQRARSIYSFSHLTFQEYFTARYIVDHWGEEIPRNTLLDHLLEPRWREVTLLACAMLPSADDVLFALRRAMSACAATETRRLLEEIKHCVRSQAKYPAHVSRAWAFVFILDRLHALRIYGTRGSGVPSYPREVYLDSYFNDPIDEPRGYTKRMGRYLLAHAAAETQSYLDHILDRSATIARVIDPLFNRRMDFAQRREIREAVDYTSALDLVRGYDRIGQSFTPLETYLYGTELLLRQCFNSDCCVSTQARSLLIESALLEPWETTQ